MTACGVGAAALGAALFARRLHRQTHGLGTAELGRLHEYHEALVHSVRAGLVMIGRDGTVVLCNDEARTLLAVQDVAPGARVVELGLEPGLGELMASGRTCDVEVFPVGERTLVVTQVPAMTDGAHLGWITTLSDRTDMLRLTGELDSLRQFTDSLRAQAHEGNNRLHTVVALVELGQYEEAVEFATSTLTQTQTLVDLVTASIDEPPLVALLLGKAAQAAERGVSLELEPGTALPLTGIDPGDLVVVLGNLLDNAIDAALEADPPRWVRAGAFRSDDQLVVQVGDSGPGLPPELLRHAFTRGWSTKEERPEEDGLHGRGLGLTLVHGTVRRLGGTIEVQREVGAKFVVRLPVHREAGR